MALMLSFCSILRLWAWTCFFLVFWTGKLTAQTPFCGRMSSPATAPLSQELNNITAKQMPDSKPLFKPCSSLFAMLNTKFLIIENSLMVLRQPDTAPIWYIVRPGKFWSLIYRQSNRLICCKQQKKNTTHCCVASITNYCILNFLTLMRCFVHSIASEILLTFPLTQAMLIGVWSYKPTDTTRLLCLLRSFF